VITGNRSVNFGAKKDRGAGATCRQKIADACVKKFVSSGAGKRRQTVAAKAVAGAAGDGINLPFLG